VVDDAASQTLGALAEQLARGAAEHEEARGCAGPVSEDPERAEQLGGMLDLVDDDESSQVPQGEERLLEASEVLRLLEVEEGRGCERALGERAPAGPRR
jgi:hypothetical protein